MLKKSYYTRPFPGAPRRAPSRALFSHRSKPQRTARVRLGFSLAAALLDGLFEHPAVSLSVMRDR